MCIYIYIYTHTCVYLSLSLYIYRYTYILHTALCKVALAKGGTPFIMSMIFSGLYYYLYNEAPYRNSLYYSILSYRILCHMIL